MREDMVKAAASAGLSVSGEDICHTSLTEAPLSEPDANDLAAVFAAISDPVRLRLLSIVASKEEVCSCDLERPLERSQPTISHHTRILSEAGLITAENAADRTWWRIDSERLGAVRRALGGS